VGGTARTTAEPALSTIDGTEVRKAPRTRGQAPHSSPLTVAFEDLVLQVEGLRGDRVGDAVEFFDLAHGELHRLVCSCHYGRTVAAGVVAPRVRMMARQNEPATLSSRAMLIGGLSAAAALGLVFLAF
jgi:hypothetical protein